VLKVQDATSNQHALIMIVTRWLHHDKVKRAPLQAGWRAKMRR